MFSLLGWSVCLSDLPSWRSRLSGSISAPVMSLPVFFYSWFNLVQFLSLIPFHLFIYSYLFDFVFQFQPQYSSVLVKTSISHIGSKVTPVPLSQGGHHPWSLFKQPNSSRLMSIVIRWQFGKLFGALIGNTAFTRHNHANYIQSK